MTYKEVVKNGLILPKKEKYTLKDFKKLVNAGYTQLEARFITICSGIFYFDYEPGHVSQIFFSSDFTTKCKYNNALI